MAGGVAIIVWQLGRLALYAAGIRIHGRTIRIASLDEIHPGLVNSWAATRLFFGFTSEVQPVRRILSFLVFASMLAIPLVAVTKKHSLRLLWLALPAATLGAFVTSREALDLGAGRYLLFMVMSLRSQPPSCGRFSRTRLPTQQLRCSRSARSRMLVPRLLPFKGQQWRNPIRR
jgi:hypothetical protein